MSKPSYMPPKKTVTFNGVKLSVYSVGWLALLVKRTTASVREWERRGFLPKPLLKVDKDSRRRYYTVAELAGYASCYHRANVRRSVPTEDTTFPKDCLTLNAHLRAMMVGNPKALGTALKNEAELAESKNRHQASRIASEVSRITTGKRKPLTY